MPTGPPPESAAHGFYRRTMETLNEAGLPYLVGGGYALGHYTAVERDTKDFDIFVRREEYDSIMKVLSQAGFHTELTFPHWLGKATCEHGYVDVIFNSGNGLAYVDEGWFKHAAQGEVFGVPAKLSGISSTWSCRRPRPSTGPGSSPASGRTGGCCSHTCACSDSSTRPSATGFPIG